jgi:hypothetical protein
MKKDNARVGMKVEIKDGAWLVEDDSAGDVLIIREIGDRGVYCTPLHHPFGQRHYYGFEEVRRLKGHAYL